jgi:hypothetical protein
MTTSSVLFPQEQQSPFGRTPPLTGFGLVANIVNCANRLHTIELRLCVVQQALVLVLGNRK